MLSESYDPPGLVQDDCCPGNSTGPLVSRGYFSGLGGDLRGPLVSFPTSPRDFTLGPSTVLFPLAMALSGEVTCNSSIQAGGSRGH